MRPTQISNKSIRKIAWNEAGTFTLGHCNLITTLCRRKKVPKSFDDGELHPIQAMTLKYFNEYETDPVIAPAGVNVEGVHVEEPGNVEAVDAEEEDEMMEEIDRYVSGVHPDQQQNNPAVQTYTHSEHE
ncbi:hypothetical protein A2U01_0058554, partial [Trifolium medium]|nr:hypothetical protein [Trifolium medium]